jgi:hypothetical protein
MPALAENQRQGWCLISVRLGHPGTVHWPGSTTHLEGRMWQRLPLHRLRYRPCRLSFIVRILKAPGASPVHGRGVKPPPELPFSPAMLTGIALALSEVPLELIERNQLESRLRDRGGERELWFLWAAAERLLPVWHEGKLQLLRWGNRRARAARCRRRSGRAWRRWGPASERRGAPWRRSAQRRWGWTGGCDTGSGRGCGRWSSRTNTASCTPSRSSPRPRTSTA